MNTNVIEYKCPCCSAGLQFEDDSQQLQCEYCDNTFDLATVRAFNESQAASDAEQVQWETEQQQNFSEEEQSAIQSFICPSCGGEILSDQSTAATFCPYCDHPTVMPSRLSGSIRPDGVIPFKTDKEDAKAAFLKLCQGKPLLPKEFTARQRLERITGVYVPFWLFDCDADFDGTYKATRIHRWSDSQYNYTKTDHFLLRRGAEAAFSGIPMDGSSKMEDSFMESIEPYDYGQMVPFDMAYLSGYLADKYDVEAESGEGRIKQRVDQSIRDAIQSSMIGYTTVLPTSRQLQVNHSKAKYVLLPVWVLNTKYNDKIYTFAMNGQTGKITGEFPACPKRTAGWFAGICAGVTLIATVAQLLF